MTDAVRGLAEAVHGSCCSLADLLRSPPTCLLSAAKRHGEIHEYTSSFGEYPAPAIGCATPIVLALLMASRLLHAHAGTAPLPSASTQGSRSISFASRQGSGR